jgi:hypothetical protein
MTDDNLNEHMLRDLQKRTAELPREIAPPAGAWTAIKAQIDLEPVTRLSTRARRFWQRPEFLAAAALLLVASSSLVTALVIGRRTVANAERPGAASAIRSTPTPRSPAAGHVTLAEFTARENDYIATANELSAVIESGRAELAPETIAKLRESVRIIDAAIIEARRALAADPANQALMEMLSTSYSQKVDLLKRTAAMGET